MGRFGKFGFPKQLILIFLEHFSDHLALFYFWGVVKDCCAGYPGDLVTLHTSWCLLPGLHNCRLGGLHWIPEGRHLQNSNGCLSPTFHLTLADSLLRPSLDPHSSHQMSQNQQNQGTKWGPPLGFLMLNTLVPLPGAAFLLQNIQPCAVPIFMNKRDSFLNFTQVIHSTALWGFQILTIKDCC